VLFRDRTQAGERLAARLQSYRGAPDTVVLGIPRGGIVVAAAISSALALPLGICPVRKLGAPGNSELAIGAVDDDSGLVLDRGLARRLGVTVEELEAEVQKQRTEIKRWLGQFGEDVSRVQPGQQVILTDDGIATGATARAGIKAVRRKGARRVILAVPVAPRDSFYELSQLVDEAVCIATPDPFYAVGNFFDHWPQVTDSEVMGLLRPAPAG
jgi:predicted phosphoribosyltransferase